MTESPTLELDSPTEQDVAPAEAQQLPPKPAKRDAFTELLAPKPKHPKHGDPSTSSKHIPPTSKRRAIGGPRDGLGVYITKPESFPSNVVVYYDDDFVVIHDMFPKATLHLLLLPRDPQKTRLHPFEAFEDVEFLAKVKKETQKLRKLAAGELRRIHGKYSAQDKERQEALNVEPPLEELPPGRNWEQEIVCGIHAHPSMNHLHVHVISVDRFSDRLKHRKHYNSFSTPFFVNIDDFPLAPDDVRRQPDEQGYLRRDFVCWRCGKQFGNKFAELKLHLKEEFDAWRKL